MPFAKDVEDSSCFSKKAFKRRHRKALHPRAEGASWEVMMLLTDQILSRIAEHAVSVILSYHRHSKIVLGAVEDVSFGR